MRMFSSAAGAAGRLAGGSPRALAIGGPGGAVDAYQERKDVYRAVVAAVGVGDLAALESCWPGI
jgi:hypothetical protein